MAHVAIEGTFVFISKCAIPLKLDHDWTGQGNKYSREDFQGAGKQTYLDSSFSASVAFAGTVLLGNGPVWVFQATYQSFSTGLEHARFGVSVARDVVNRLLCKLPRSTSWLYSILQTPMYTPSTRAWKRALCIEEDRTQLFVQHQFFLKTFVLEDLPDHN